MVFNPLDLTLKNGDHLPLQLRNKKCFSKTPYGRRISLKNITWHYKRIYSTDIIKYVYEGALRPIEKQN